jgi:DNA mismatch repair protein MutL
MTIMSIHALPDTAVRTIRSGQALTDPLSVVKELLDNALDARATNIAVEISTNTLDVIQVKDNGHGVAPSDRLLLAKSYCTSKLNDEKDLALVGSSYLGFRGEALSSALEMSGDMVITTRVEGESVATAIKPCQLGDPTQERATHPPGTTVRISNFLKNQPVRKQVALKMAPKTLTRIKLLLQSYAFARPAVRLSLKVIKAKNDKDNWIYAPKIGSGIQDTALKVVGKPCASQCAWAELVYEGFVLQAFLPRPDAHASKINSLGQYVSVNGRPLTPSRGIVRQLVRIYRERLNEIASLTDAKDPFLYLSLACPPGSYDANIEPAKDDVLFGDVDKVVEAFERLMAIAYPEEENSTPDLRDRPRKLFTISDPQIKPSTSILKGNMYEHDEDDLTLLMDSVDQPEGNIDEEEEEPEAIRSAAISNPWVMAKMTSYGNKTNNTNIQLLTPARQASSSMLEVISPAPEMNHPHQDTPGLPTPRPSSPVFSQSEESNASALNRVIGPSHLPPPVLHMSGRGLSPLRNSVESFEQSPAPRRISLAVQQDHTGTSLHLVPEAAPRRPSPQKQPQRQFVNKPFVSPVDPERDAWFHFPEAQNSKKSTRKRQQQESSSDGYVPAGEPYSRPQSSTPPPNNADIRDFLGRNREQQSTTPIPAVLAHDTAPTDEIHHEIQPKGFVKASELNLNSTQFDKQPIQPAPKAKPRRRKTSDRPAKEPQSKSREKDTDSENNASDSDYEEGPLRRRHRHTADSTTTKRARRIKSSNLPLENIPPNQQLQRWKTTIPLTLENLSQQLRTVEPTGTFTAWNAPALDAQAAELNRVFVENDVRRWTRSLGQMLLLLEPEAEVVRDLGHVVENAMGRWGTFAASSSSSSS